jgi:hypothetical protein
MKVLKMLMGLSGGVLVLVGVMGCDVFVQRSSPRDTVYVQQSPEPQYVIVREAPPPVLIERRPPMPGQGYIWIDGYQHWNGQRYEWHRGEWARPPHAQAVWVAPRYEKHDQGYRYIPGQWRDEPQERPRDDRDRR